MSWLWSACGAFAFLTGGHVIWMVLTTGDSCCDVGLYVGSVFALSLIGGVLGRTGSQSSKVRIGLMFLLVCSILFWLLVPDGWWITPPPLPSERRLTH